MRFGRFCEEWARLSLDKYTLPDGRNAGLARDNPVDVLEELADAYNICWLWIEHLIQMRRGPSRDVWTIKRIVGFMEAIELLANDVESIAGVCKHLADEDVERLVDWRNG